MIDTASFETNSAMALSKSGAFKALVLIGVDDS